MVLFPFFVREGSWPWNAGEANGAFWSRIRKAYYNREWRKRFDTYKVKLANSNFSRVWATRRWGINCEVVYPPVHGEFRPVAKRNMILSVGRFAGEHPKRQLEMVTAFDGLKDLPGGWEYYTVGVLGESAQDREYFDRVESAAGVGTHVIANLPRQETERLFEECKIFWHGVGFCVDDKLHPEFAEHFGIVTAEAMAAGCVPLVQKKGGQAEIVEHGKNGFFWDSLADLKEYTRLLARDDRLRQEMGAAARSRAQLFTKDKFVAGILKHLPSFSC